MNRAKPLAVTIVIFCALSLLAITPLIIGFGKTGKNTQILGKDYSLLTKSQILSRLSVDFPLPESLTLVHESRTFTLPLASISATLNHHQIANNLLFRRLNQGFSRYFTAFFQPKSFELEYTFDSTAVDNYLANLSTQINRPFVPSELAHNPKTKAVVVNPGVLGQTLDVNKLREQILFALTHYQFSSPLSLPISVSGQLPTSDDSAQALVTAAKLKGKTLEIVLPDQSTPIDEPTLISWVSLLPHDSCHLDNLTEYANSLIASSRRDPVEPVFKFENGQVLEFRPSTPGYYLDNQDNGQTVVSAICNGLTNLINQSDKRLSVTLPVITVDAQTATADVNDLGIRELLGRGVSTFRHSSAIRNMNVERGASVVNRILVAPGETFSFLKALGDVSLANGYKMAYVIRSGKTELDVGGGICQVSTTFFRALLNSGLDIIERKNHAYRVQYYEEDMPPGYDATVFIPSPDLKFINDTGHHLLIQSQYDGKAKKLTYEIYGTSDGRQVEINNYRQWGWAPAPPTVYIDDPTLPSGKLVKEESAIPGLKTSFDWKVTRGGEIIHQKTFQSVFTPWAAVYRRGTGN